MAVAVKCQVIRAGQASEGVTGVQYAPGISAATVGAAGLCMELAVIPPGARAKAHLHRDHESAAYIIEGELILWFGDGLRESVTVGPGDFLYIPPGVPHLPMNCSQNHRAVAILARSDPREQENVVPLPELDGLSHLMPPAARNH
ncbi:MAG: cupin domain-containing protein [Armatimonadota bacterium]